MSNFYLAPTRKGRMLKIVEDVKVPISDKLQKLGVQPNNYLVRQRLVARFVNEDEAKKWLIAYKQYVELEEAVEACPFTYWDASKQNSSEK